MEYIVVLDSFPSRLKQAIQRVGGNKEVIDNSGIASGTLNNYIAGTSEPSLSKLVELASACQVSLDFLAYGGNIDEQLSVIHAGALHEKSILLAIESVEEALADSNRNMLPKDKAELIVTIYNIYSKEQKTLNKEDVRKILKHVG